MAVRFNDIRAAQKDKDAAFEPNIERVKAALVGKDSATSAAVTGRPGYVWVKRYDQEAGLGAVLNRSTSTTPGLPVVLQRQLPDGQWEVNNWDTAIIPNLSTYTGQQYQTAHAATHQSGGTDPLYIESKMLIPLRVTPAAGLTVDVAPLVYEYAGAMASFAGALGVDLSSYKPAAGLAQYVLISLTVATGALAYTAGGTTIDSAAVLPAWPTIPTGVIPAALVRLDGSQTSIAESDIIDARPLFSVNNYLDAGKVSQLWESDGGAAAWSTDTAGNLSGTKAVQGVFDHKLTDTANASGIASHFRDNAAVAPSGWTEVDAPDLTNTSDLYSFWQLRGSRKNTAWKYRRQTAVNVESDGSNIYQSFQFGPILFKDIQATADIDYIFGMYRDNSGIDEATYSRVRLHWDYATSVWQVRGEASDGITATNSSYINITSLDQPLFLRVMVRNDTGKQTRQYLGAHWVGNAQRLIQSINKTATWGQVWLQVEMSRGEGNQDYIFIGAVDYLRNIA